MVSKKFLSTLMVSAMAISPAVATAIPTMAANTVKTTSTEDEDAPDVSRHYVEDFAKNTAYAKYSYSESVEDGKIFSKTSQIGPAQAGTAEYNQVNTEINKIIATDKKTSDSYDKKKFNRALNQAKSSKGKLVLQYYVDDVQIALYDGHGKPLYSSEHVGVEVNL